MRVANGRTDRLLPQFGAPARYLKCERFVSDAFLKAEKTVLDSAFDKLLQKCQPPVCT